MPPGSQHGCYSLCCGCRKPLQPFIGAVISCLLLVLVGYVLWLRPARVSNCLSTIHTDLGSIFQWFGRHFIRSSCSITHFIFRSSFFYHHYYHYFFFVSLSFARRCFFFLSFLSNCFDVTSKCPEKWPSSSSSSSFFNVNAYRLLLEGR